MLIQLAIYFTCRFLTKLIHIGVIYWQVDNGHDRIRYNIYLSREVFELGAIFEHVCIFALRDES